MATEQERSAPVIVITGTPGTGKSTTASMLVDASPIPLKHLNVGDLVKLHSLHDGFDDEWQSYLVDDDKVELHFLTSTVFTDSVVNHHLQRLSTNSSRSLPMEALSSTGTRVISSLNAGSI